MLAKLTQIDAMIGLISGGERYVENDNLINKNNKFSMIKDNEIDKDEVPIDTSADNIVAVDGIRPKKENINKKDYIEEETVERSINNEDGSHKTALNKTSIRKNNSEDSEANAREANLVDKTNLLNGIINNKAKNHISIKSKNGEKHNQLIQKFFDNKANAYRVNKESLKESFSNIEDVKQKFVPKEIIRNVITNRQDNKRSAILHKVDKDIKKDFDGKLDVAKLINNKSTNTEKSNTIKSFPDKLNIKNINDSVGKIKVINKLDSKTSKIGQIINNNINQSNITDKATRIEVNQENIDISGRNIKSDISTDINKQILESIHSSISRQGIEKHITVQLNPPELGKVLIKFQEQDAQITGLLEVSKPETRLEIEQTLPQIIKNLNDSGIQIRKLEVVSTGINQSQQESQESFKEQLFSGDDTAQGNSTANDARREGSDNTVFYDWFSNKSDMGGSVLENMFIDNDSINMLM